MLPGQHISIQSSHISSTQQPPVQSVLYWTMQFCTVPISPPILSCTHSFQAFAFCTLLKLLLLKSLIISILLYLEVNCQASVFPGFPATLSHFFLMNFLNCFSGYHTFLAFLLLQWLLPFSLFCCFTLISLSSK